ncbi:uncharacterized protein LOC108864069 [Galendromus occidentalis]|uniref:Uncharacterized protein LOC108864069 n=1 Tax=Galendromus occidentalis TaxID=34638 RepID=A0AAJ7P9X7_9ACAR|nr:uncharacterized protein LOC108864069 [Galendromus occidentalis]
MEILLNVVSEFGTEVQLNFNPTKSAIVVFNDENLGQPTPMFIQQKEIERQDQYKYLGITLSDKPNYLHEHELFLRKKAEVALQRMHAQCLWTFDKFEVSKIQWKATAVPTLTYANAVLASRNQRALNAHFEKTQMSAGRWALGITGYKVANEFIQGEIGWSSFEAREAQSRIRYFTRISSMEAHRWPRAILSMMALTDTYTEAVKRLKILRKKYLDGEIPVVYTNEGRPLLSKFYKEVKLKVRETQDKAWREGMSRKPSLQIYNMYKERRGLTAVGTYNNRRGSTLLALARAGMLPTRKYRSKFQNIHPYCCWCGMEEETIQHVLLECTPHHFNEEELRKKLGLQELLDPAQRPFQKLMMDHLGPLPKFSGKEHIIVLVDSFSKYVMLEAVKSTETRHVITFLGGVFMKYGAPAVLISDRGTASTSKKLGDFLQGKGVEHVLNSTQHPQGNGQTERMNRTVTALLRTLCRHPEKEDWGRHLQEVACHINRSPAKSTGKAPFEILHGYLPPKDGFSYHIENQQDGVTWRPPQSLRDELSMAIARAQE